MDDALRPGGDHRDLRARRRRAVTAALKNAIRSSVAQIDKASAKEVKAASEAPRGWEGDMSSKRDRGFVVVTGTSRASAPQRRPT